MYIVITEGTVVICFHVLSCQLSITCDENELHIAVLFCTVCSTHLCVECSENTHSTRTLARHKRVPISEKPRENPKCVYHPMHLVEFACLEDECKSSPLMCYICKDYGRHMKHKVKMVIGQILSCADFFLFNNLCQIMQQILINTISFFIMLVEASQIKC